MGVSLDGWKASVPFAEDVKIWGSRGKKRRKKKTLSADLATLGHFPSPKKGGGEKPRTRAKVREGEMKKEKKKKKKQQEEASRSREEDPGWTSQLRMQKNTTRIPTALGCQGARTRCSIREIFQQQRILSSRCLKSGGLVYLLLLSLGGFNATAEESRSQPLEKEKEKKKKLNGDLQKYKYLYLQQNKMLYVRKIFFQGTWELFRQHTRYKNGKQKNPKRRFKYFGIESPLYSIV